jgi:hypothetical protein
MSRRWVLLLTGVAGVVLGTPGVEASAIHHRDKSSADAREHRDASPGPTGVYLEWSRYLAAGPKVWARVVHPPVTKGVDAWVWKDVRTDPGGDDRMVDFLLYKQSVDPPRFDHYHPNLAPILHRIALSRVSKETTQAIAPSTGSGGSTSTSAPATIPTPVTIEPQNLVPSPSPEPNTLLIAFGMAAWAVVQARRVRRGA